MAKESPEAIFNGTLRTLKLGECCETITFNSFSQNRTYQNYPTTLKLYKEDCCGRRSLLEEVIGHPTGYIDDPRPYTFDELCGDGTYILETSVYIQQLDVTYRKELKVCATCCEDKRCELAGTVAYKMACISCKIQERKAVGRKTHSLEEDYLRLSNIYYLLDSQNCVGKIPMTCDEVELLRCSIKKIK